MRVLTTAFLLILSLIASGGMRCAAQARHEFGFSLNPTAQGGLHALFIYTVLDGVVVGSIPMRAGPFILQASGLMESKANLESIDLFEEYGIRDCGVWATNTVIHTNFECLPIQDLWKLRYRTGMGMQPGKGWAAEEFKPSVRQEIILQHYRSPNHGHWHGPYLGKDAFRLLRDMQDPAWVETYQHGG